MIATISWRQMVTAQVSEILDPDIPDKKGATRTIFHELRDSDLPPHENTLPYLCFYGTLLTDAGTETTARALPCLTYYLSQNPKCLECLREKIKTVKPSPDVSVSAKQLEQLPYLSNVIQEGLIHSFRVVTRLPRIATHEDLVYKQCVIPKVTPVSETMYFIVTDPNIFPEPFAFRPERWLEAKEELQKFRSFSFGRGSRSCLGINLAYAELHLTVAEIFTHFDFDLYKTTEKDVACIADAFVPAPADSSEGVRVCISRCEGISSTD